MSCILLLADIVQFVRYRQLGGDDSEPDSRVALHRIVLPDVGTVPGKLSAKFGLHLSEGKLKMHHSATDPETGYGLGRGGGGGGKTGNLLIPYFEGTGLAEG